MTLNNLQIVKYIPPKRLSCYGLPGSLLVMIYSYLKINDYNHYIKTYYSICINTGNRLTDNPLEMARVVDNRLYPERFLSTITTLQNIITNFHMLKMIVPIETLQNTTGSSLTTEQIRVAHRLRTTLINLATYGHIEGDIRSIINNSLRSWDNIQLMSRLCEEHLLLLRNKHIEVREILELLNEIREYPDSMKIQYIPFLATAKLKYEDIHRDLEEMQVGLSYIALLYS